MTLTPVILAQGQLDPIVSVNALQFGEEEFQLIPAPQLTATHYNGQTGTLQVVAALNNQLPVDSISAPKDAFGWPDTPVAVVRTQPFVALTPAEVELNREVAYTAYSPVIAT
jgi:hypothetical protein